MQLSKHTFLITGGASGLGARLPPCWSRRSQRGLMISTRWRCRAGQRTIASPGYVADIADEQQADNAVNAAFADWAHCTA